MISTSCSHCHGLKMKKKNKQSKSWIRNRKSSENLMETVKYGDMKRRFWKWIGTEEKLMMAKNERLNFQLVTAEDTVCLDHSIEYLKDQDF